MLSYDGRYHGYRCLQCQVSQEINDIMFVCVREKRRKGMNKTSKEQHVVNKVTKTDSFFSSAGLAALNKLVAMTPKTNLCQLNQI